MKIAVVCLASRTGGGLTILRDLHRFAIENGTDHEWLFVLSDQDLSRSAENVQLVRTAPHYNGWISRIRAELTVCRRSIKGFAPDVVLSLQNVDTPARGRRPLAIYMHQPLPFADTRFSLLKGAERGLALRQIVLGALIRASIRRADITFVQTQWIADAVRAACPGANVMKVSYYMPDAAVPPPPKRSETTGFLYPASAALYKDHATLHKAVRLRRSQNENTGRVAITLTRSAFEGLVGSLTETEADWYDFIGEVSPSMLNDIYARSILVFPSYIETLGLPLYEAQVARCRIVAANTPPAREALHSYPGTYYFVPRSPTDLARAMSEAWEFRDAPVVHKGSSDRHGHNTQSPWSAIISRLAEILGRNHA